MFADEPPFDSDLLERSDVIVTPHVAGNSHTSIAAMTAMATRSVLDVLAGRLPPAPVNPEAL